MSSYLYGASVQGIQGFIFATNKLQEIVGASEIVKSINQEFEEKFSDNDEVEILLNAAGNIKAVFKNKDTLEKFILDFSKSIEQKAYGITISQAVVKFGSGEAKDHINELEKKLKTQRNKPTIPLDLSIGIMKLNPSTAKPEVLNGKDMATKQKRDAYARWFKDKRYDSSEFEKSKELRYISNGKNKIAVIHIDGNGLGQLIPRLTMPLSEFSQKLDAATKKAFEDAVTSKMKIREIILGGDDVTVICNANDALALTKSFLKNFENETKKTIGKLTACAGIAYCNEKYPFHYAVDLAEKLCDVAKKHSKAIDEQSAPSCLMFHNIQSASFQSWDKFIEDELTIKNKNKNKTIRCDFGPYYLDEPNQVKIDDFLNSVEAYRCDGSPISRLRNWLSELYKDDVLAQNLLDRINKVTEQSGKWNCNAMKNNLEKLHPELKNKKLVIIKDKDKDKDNNDLNKTPIYDILQIISNTDKGQL